MRATMIALAAVLTCVAAPAWALTPLPVGMDVDFGMTVEAFQKVCPDAVEGKAPKTRARKGEKGVKVRVFVSKVDCHNLMFAGGQTEYRFRDGLLYWLESEAFTRRFDLAIAMEVGAAAAACDLMETFSRGQVGYHSCARDAVGVLSGFERTKNGATRIAISAFISGDPKFGWIRGAQLKSIYQATIGKQ